VYIATKKFTGGLQVVDKSEEERKQICLTIGQRLRKSRKEKGLTLDGLVEETGFSKSYLSQIENLKREPSIGTLTKIAYALGVDSNIKRGHVKAKGQVLNLEFNRN
jgi:transcriptional regulator with XRE-family HTH domain